MPRGRPVCIRGFTGAAPVRLNAGRRAYHARLNRHDTQTIRSLHGGRGPCFYRHSGISNGVQQSEALLHEFLRVCARSAFSRVRCGNFSCDSVALWRRCVVAFRPPAGSGGYRSPHLSGTGPYARQRTDFSSCFLFGDWRPLERRLLLFGVGTHEASPEAVQPERSTEWRPRRAPK